MKKLLVFIVFPLSVYAGGFLSRTKEPKMTTILITRKGQPFAQEIVLSTKQAKKLLKQMRDKRQRQPVITHPVIIHRQQTKSK